MIKNSEEIAMMSGILVFLMRETRIRKIIKSFEENKSSLPETGLSQAANLETQKQTKWIGMHQSQVNMCFLTGPLR